jgi:hypothetical protein
MSFDACAALVERADTERFRAIMASPVADRPTLFALIAMNAEVARAPWVTQEPMIAEMRLQWWRDALEEIATGSPVRRHDVTDALAKVLDPEGAKALDAMIAARRWDIYSDAFEDEAHLHDYLASTSGTLMWTAARLLGARQEQVIRDFGWGVGVANLLRASVTLDARGRKPLIDGTPSGIRRLAERGLAALGKGPRGVCAGQSALLTGFMARPVLRRVVKSPDRVAAGQTMPGPMAISGRLALAATLGWWR